MTPSKSVISALIALAAYLLFLPNANATTYYVRTDGGDQTQCTGTKDSPYPGSGSKQACAFKHPYLALSPQGNNPSLLKGGDTLIIDGSNNAQYMMGYGAPNTADTSKCSIYWPWDCVMRPVPSGPDPDHPTRILGRGWDSGCSAPPQLWGTQRLKKVLDLTGSNNVEIQCVEITDHSECQEFGPQACNRSNYPYGEWASQGIEASDSSNVLLKNVNIHGMANKGVLAGRLNNWTVSDSQIVGNPFAGWDGDIGGGSSANSGNMVFNRVRIEYNGCAEKYPENTPYACFSQSQGGYGDGLGTNSTGGNWLFANSSVSHNTQDGIDLWYHTGAGSVTLLGTRTEGNAGNQVKSAADTVIYNSLVVGNCAYFNGNAITRDSASFDHCRALGNSVVLKYHAGMTAAIANSTITSNGDNLIISAGSGCDGTEVLMSRNNIFLGRGDFHGGDDATLYFASGDNGEGHGSCGQIKLNDDYALIYGTKAMSTDCSGKSHAQCVDPKLIEPLVPAYKGTLFNAGLKAESAAIGNALPLSGVPSVDFNGFDRGGSWDVGALQYGSAAVEAPDTAVAPGIGATIGNALIAALTPETTPPPTSAPPSTPVPTTPPESTTPPSETPAPDGGVLVTPPTSSPATPPPSTPPPSTVPPETVPPVTTPPADGASPSVPAGLSASAISPTQINLSWGESTDEVGVVGYKIYRDSALIGTSATTAFADTGLTPATTYSYMVAAYDAAGNDSAASAAVTATTQNPPDTAPPSVPADLSATGLSPTEVKLVWKASTDDTGVAGYKIFRDGQQIATTAALNYTDANLTALTTYTYTITAFDAAANTSDQTPPASVSTLPIPDKTSPTTPTGVKAVAASDTQVEVSWTPSSDNVGVTGYRIFRNRTMVGTSATASYSDAGLSGQTQYSYKVMAYDAAGNNSGQSRAATVTTLAPPDTAAPSAPAGLSAAAVSTTEISLSWNASTDNVGVSGYKVFRNSAQIATTATPGYADTSLEPSKTYAYKVQAYDAAGNASNFSATVNGTTQTPKDTTPPSTPAGLTAVAVSTTQIDLTWTPSSDDREMGQYKIFRDAVQVGTSSLPSYADLNLNPATAYSYNVVAVDAAGNSSAASTSASTATLEPPAPVETTPPVTTAPGPVSDGTYTVYYVRDDGGDPSVCNGRYDAPDPGNGTTKNCAWSHPAYAIGGTNGTQRISGGDTLIIDGESHVSRGQQAQYVVGWGMPNTNTSVCAAGYPYGCELARLPSGPDSSHPTRILGKGWNSGCANPPQLWGTNSVNQILTLSGVNNLDLKCVEITDHSNCGFRVGNPQCSENYPDPGTYGRNGIYAYGGSNWTFDHVNIHGMSKAGLNAGGIKNLTVTNSHVDGNYFAGWDWDIGESGSESSNSGKLSFTNFTVRYNGYSEAYPLITAQGDAINYSNATDQNNNPPGYGDGFGFYKTAGTFVFDQADISHNAQDGLDMLYHTTNEMVTIQRSIMQGNDGNQAKINSSTTIENSIFIGNCSYPMVAGKVFNKDSFVTCRAGGDAILLGFPTGAVHKFYNSTIWTEGSSAFLLKDDHWGQTCDGSETIKIRNSVLQGKTGTSLVIDQRSGTCSTIKPDFDYTASFNFSGSPKPAGAHNLNNTDPKFVSPISLSAADNVPNVYLQSSSPAVGKADPTLAVTSANDYNNFVRGASWDMGALQYGSTSSN